MDNDDLLVEGGQGREPESLLADAMNLARWFVIIACLFIFLATCTGCDGGRGPNTEAPKNNLRRAIADPNYKAEPYGKKDPNDPPYLYPPSQPVNRAQKMVDEQYPRD